MNQIPNIEEVEQKLVKHLVDRFCGWHLPKDFHPDGGIMFMDVYDNGTEQGGKFEPVGTNLFTAEQAKEMFRFLLEHEDGTPILTELFHHQLQKARQNWLREEIVRLEGMLSRWVAAYMPADEGKDPSRWGFKTEKEAWDFIEKRLTPCPLDPQDKSGEPCDSCMAEWMVYQIPEVDQALQTIIDRYHSELDQDKALQDKK